MFDIGWTELVVIGVVALIVIGPKELPGVLRMLGQWMTKVRRMAAEFQGQFQEAMREAEMADLKKQVEQLGDSAGNLTSFDPIETARREVESAFEDKPQPPHDAAPTAVPSEVEASFERDATLAGAPDAALPTPSDIGAAPAEPAATDAAARKVPEPEGGGRAA